MRLECIKKTTQCTVLETQARQIARSSEWSSEWSESCTRNTNRFLRLMYVQILIWLAQSIQNSVVGRSEFVTCKRNTKVGVFKDWLGYTVHGNHSSSYEFCMVRKEDEMQVFVDAYTSQRKAGDQTSSVWHGSMSQRMLYAYVKS